MTLAIIYARAGTLESVSDERMQVLTEGGKLQWINPYQKLKDGNAWMHPVVQCSGCGERFRITSCECGHRWIEAVVPQGGQYLYVRHPGVSSMGIPPHLIDRWMCRCGTENLIPGNPNNPGSFSGRELLVLEKR
jgi:hypothetical protein